MTRSTITATGLWSPGQGGVVPWRSNAELIARGVAPLGYLLPTDLVLDATYGRGAWWRELRPPRLIGADLETATDVRSDYRRQPFGNEVFDVVAFDPPYTCADTATEILTKRGWLRYDEVKRGDVAYTLNHDIGHGEWQPVTEVVIAPRERRRMISMESKSHSSLTTVDHRWPVLARRRSGRGPMRTWRTSDSFAGDDVVPSAASCADLPDEPIHPDALVECVAWFWTEGSRPRKGSTYTQISQSSKVNPDNCERIRTALGAMFGPATTGGFPRVGRETDGTPRWRERACSSGGPGRNDMVAFVLSSDAGAALLLHAPDMVPSVEFLTSLTASQLDLFIETSIAADGHRPQSGTTTLGQVRREMAEAFALALILAGRSVTITEPPVEGGQWTVHVRGRRTFKPSRAKRSVVDVEGIVWCVRVPNQSWLARRNGKVYFTGNSTGGRETSTIGDFNDRFGLANAPRTPDDLQSYNEAGLAECYRIVRPGGHVLMKSANYVSSGHLFIGAHMMAECAVDLGFEVVDWFVYTGTVRVQPERFRKCRACNESGVVAGVEGEAIECPACDGEGRTPSPGQQHARQNVSHLHVLRRPRPTRRRRNGAV